MLACSKPRAPRVSPWVRAEREPLGLERVLELGPSGFEPIAQAERQEKWSSHPRIPAPQGERHAWPASPCRELPAYT